MPEQRGSTPNTEIESGNLTSQLDGVRSSFADAVGRCDGISAHRFQLAGAVMELRFASPTLRDQLTRPFAHLAVPADESSAADLTVSLWDSSSTGAKPPPRPLVPDEYAEGALFHFHEPPIRVAYQPGLESLSVLDAETNEAWHWVADAAAQPYWDKASPIRQILFWWLSSRNYLQVHGAGVGTADGGVLLVGRGGSGKSTTALSSLGSGVKYAGDDYVAFTLEPEPRVQSLYSSGKLEPPHLQEFLPHLLPLLSNREQLSSEKAVVYLHDHFPDDLVASFPLRAVLVPKVMREQTESRIVEVSRAAAFAALAPSTIFQLHTAGPDTLSMMSQLLKRVPCFGLELGSDIPGIPRAIAEFLSRPVEE